MEIFLYFGFGDVTVEIIHQTWKTRTVPDHLKKFVESWKKFNPDWEWRMWNDKDNRNLVLVHFPEYLPMYDNLKKSIMRADVIRYFILWKFGGLYADLDFEALQPMDTLLADSKDQLWLPSWTGAI